MANKRIYKDYEELIDFLLVYGPNLNDIRTNQGKTLFSETVPSYNIVTTTILLENGLDPNIIDYNGNTAIDYIHGPYKVSNETYEKFVNLFKKY